MKPLPPFQIPSLEPLCDLAVTIGQPIEVGLAPQGLRRIIPITGGVLTWAPTLAAAHPALRPAQLQPGTVLPGGADFQRIVSGGTTAHLDARYALELADGARVFVQNTALRFASADTSARLLRGELVDPSEVYFRCQPCFETAAPEWAWLQQSQFIGTGVRLPDAVHLRFFRVA